MAERKTCYYVIINAKFGYSNCNRFYRQWTKDGHDKKEDKIFSNNMNNVLSWDFSF